MKKRIFSMLIAICMVFSTFPMSLLAEASDVGSGASNVVDDTGDVGSGASNVVDDTGDVGSGASNIGSGASNILTTENEFARLAVPAAVLVVGDTFIAPITVGGQPVDCTFKMLTDSTVQIGDGTSAAIAVGTVGEITIPPSISDGTSTYNVTAIGNNAFKDCKGFNGKLTIPSSVTTIGNNAFKDCSGLNGALIIESGVETIGESAFWYCSGLTGDLTIPDSVKTIGEGAFLGCSGLTGALTIPNSVTTIATRTFAYCGNLTGPITIPNSVKTIDEGAFEECGKLTGDLTIPDSVKTIGISAFKYCKGFNGKLTIPDSVETIGKSAFWYCSALTGDLTIPDSVKTIGESAFQSCTSLNGKLTIGSGVETIGKSAFNSCAKLTGDLTIPNSVKTIGEWAFLSCSGLTGALTIPNSVTTIATRTFAYCRNLTGTLTIPNSVKTIDEGAFEECGKLTGDLTIPSSVTTIGKSAFEKCKGFTGDFTIPDSVTTIGERAFAHCAGLNGKLTIPSSVKTIADGTFTYCGALTGPITIPSSVTTIDANAFSTCLKLTTVIIKRDTPAAVGHYAFYACNALTKIYVPTGKSAAYKAATDWTTVQGQIVESPAAAAKPNITTDLTTTGVTYTRSATATPLTIAVSAVSDGGTISYAWCSNSTNSTTNGIAITSATAATYTPPTATLGTTYYYCVVTNTNDFATVSKTTTTSNVAKIAVKRAIGDTFTAPITVGGQQVDCTFKMLTDSTVQIGDGTSAAIAVGTVGEITIPPSISDGTSTYNVTAIGNNAFDSCTKLTGKLTIPSSVTTIGNNAFSGCSGITTVIVNSQTTATIGTNVFDGCNALTKIYVPTGKGTVYKAAVNWIGMKEKIFEIPVNAEKPIITTNLTTDEVTYTQGVTTAVLTIAVNAVSDGDLTYAWYSNSTNSTTNGIAITSAIAATYTPLTTTLGTTYYYCVVTNTNDFATVSKTTTTTSAVAHITVKLALTGTVTIGGTLKFDQRLTATVSGNHSGALTYQWKRGMADITTATAGAYTTVEADIGEILTCVVTSADQAGSISGTATAEIAKADGSTTAPTAPLINYITEELATITALEYKVDSGTWIICSAGMHATVFGWDGNSAVDVQFRTPATTTHEASAAATVSIPVRPDAPLAIDFTVVKPTIKGNNGKLKGITTTMEYKTGAAIIYTDGTDTELASITDGTAYTIRTKATTSAFASKTVTVTVASKLSATVSFADAVVPYNGAEQLHETATTDASNGTMTYTYTANTGSALNTNSKPQNAGSYTVTATYESTTHIGSSAATLTINTVNVTITAVDETIVVSEALPTTYTVTATGLVGGEIISLVTFAGAPADSNTKGTHTITPSGGTIVGGSTNNYTITYQTGTLHIVLATELIDIAIDSANAAKSGIAVNEKAPASVAKGTKYVTLAEITALNDAIAAAVGAKTTVTTAAAAQAAAKALDKAVATFIAAIKTGTYSSSGGSGGSGGGGGGSSGGETPTAPPIAPPIETPIETPIVTPPPTAPTKPEEVEVKVESKKDKNGDLTVKVDNKDITDAIAKAKNKANGITIVLNVSGSKTEGNVKFNLPKSVQENIIKNKIVNTTLVIDKPDIQISMDLSAIMEINAQAQDDVNIIVNRSDLQTLSQEARNAIGNRPAFDFTVVYGNQLLVKDFKGGKVNVTIAYTLASDEDEQNIKMVYIDDNGNLNWLDSTSYSAKNQTISFETNHFSVFAVGDKSLAKPTDTAPEAQTIPAEAKSVNDTSIPLWVWIVAIAIGTAILGGSRYYNRRKKH